MLVNLFGNYPEIRVLDYITDHIFEDYTQEKLTKECMILENHLKKFLDKLENLEILNEKYGKYTVNFESPLITNLINIKYLSDNKSIINENISLRRENEMLRFSNGILHNDYLKYSTRNKKLEGKLYTASRMIADLKKQVK